MAEMNYKIGGCDVPFPHQAYGVQLSFMNKVITALEQGENALLEAPTGSGKTLSLLCSSLAWQRREKGRIEQGKLASTMAPGGGFGYQSSQTPQTSSQKEHKNEPDSNFRIHIESTSTPAWDGLDTGSTIHNAEHSVVPPVNSALADPRPKSVDTEENTKEGGFLPDIPIAEGGCYPGETSTSRRRAPRVFYATRTHSQIAQVVRELKRSGHHPRMAVLASKQQYCVNAHARDQSSLEEACDDLLKAGNCAYFKNVQSMLNSEAAWRLQDIEDLCKVGKSRKVCPYYLSRNWAQEADLVFGPYSYLVDPVIRRSMSIELENAVIIFDEAHNIEDVSREAGSLEIERITMIEVHAAFSRAAEYNGKPLIYRPLADLAGGVLKWMEAKEKLALEAVNKGGRQQGRGRYGRFQEPYERIWQGAPLLAELQELGLGPDAIEDLWQAYQDAREEDEAIGAASGKDAVQQPPRNPAAPAGSATHAVRVGALGLGVISRIIQIVKMLHQESEDGGRDYRLVVNRVHHSLARSGGDRGLGRARISPSNTDDHAMPPEYILTLSLWCLNPAVAFRQVASPAHSIILTSGTLAPLDSFASELGVQFGIRLEAPHVINMQRQVWAGVIPWGPSGSPLQATYQHTDTPAFKDSLGATVVATCRTIPDGVLLFLPSYSLLDKLVLRWKSTGIWSQLSQLKRVVTEPRGGGPDALQLVITEYYAAVREGQGGLFMAVCRGKVSEGIDFADGNARGVIVVGIPYPNVKDPKVDAKKKFNDVGVHSMGLLPGGVWYEQQAFRALNQAIGRCIRHRGDWGAILLVDERFKSPRYQKGLSRWVRSAVTTSRSFCEAVASMRQFFSRLQTDPPSAPVRPHSKIEEIEEVRELASAPIDAIAMLMAGRKSVAKGKAAPAPETEMLAHEPLPAQPLPPPSALPHTLERPIELTGFGPPRLAPHQEPRVTHTPAIIKAETSSTTIHPSLGKAPLSSWVEADLASWTHYVLEHCAANSAVARGIAFLGILDAFAMARDVILAGPLGQHRWLAILKVKAPLGVQAVIAASGPASVPNGIVLDPVAVAYGTHHLQGLPLIEILDAFELGYKQQVDPDVHAEAEAAAAYHQAAPAPAGAVHAVKRKLEGETDASGSLRNGKLHARTLPSERAGVATASAGQIQSAAAARAAREQAILEALGDSADEDSDFV